MLPFKDILGYVFRKKLAEALNLSAAQHVKADHHPNLRSEVEMQRWTGDGPFGLLLEKHPYEPVVWVCTLDGSKIKIRTEYDIANHHKQIWFSGSIVDIWLKTPLMTFNRAFPDEINVFKSSLQSIGVLQDHRRFAGLHDLEEEFDAAFIDGLPENEKSAGSDLLDQARRSSVA